MMNKAVLIKIYRNDAVQIALAYIIYLVMGYWLAGNSGLSVLIAPNPHMSTIMVAIAFGYIMLRLFILIFLPGIILLKLWNRFSPYKPVNVDKEYEEMSSLNAPERVQNCPTDEQHII